MTKVIDDLVLKAMARGAVPFRYLPLYERVALVLEPCEEVKYLSPGERLSLGYYLAARTYTPRPFTSPASPSSARSGRESCASRPRPRGRHGF